MKLECLDNPGSSQKFVIRDCKPNRFIPFGICEEPVGQKHRVYHIPTGQWVYENKSEAECNSYLSYLEGLCADQSLAWDFTKPKDLSEQHRLILISARNLNLSK